MKVMLVVFFDSRSMVYQYYVPHGTTIKSAYYIGVRTTFLGHLRRKRPEKIEQGWLLHHDNAHPLMNKETTALLAAKSVKVLFHALYSTDLATSDFQAEGEAYRTSLSTQGGPSVSHAGGTPGA